MRLLVLFYFMLVLCLKRGFANASLSDDEVTEITEMCCAYGENFAVTAASVKQCNDAHPPDDIEPDQTVICLAGLRSCCEQHYKLKTECEAGTKFAAEKRCSVPKSNIGKTCCEECSIGRWTGEAQGRDACGEPASADLDSPSSALRKNAYYRCCVEAADKPTTTERATTTTRKPETTTKAREQCRPGSCDHVCSDEGGRVVCSCREGYRLQGDRKTCKDINECAEATDDLCTAEGTVCHNVPGSFKCVPLKGRESKSKLTCPPGFKRNVENQVCDDINECQSPRPPCPKYLCENTIGGYKCNGKPGQPYREAEDAPPAEDTPPVAKNDICPPGFRSGADDECNDIDECSERADDCQRLSQHCINTHGGFFCQDHVSKRCPPGFRVNNASGVCEDIDECDESGEVCQRTEVCVNMPGAYSCKSKISTLPKLGSSKTCQEGTRLRPGSSVCEDIDECREGSHLCDQFQKCVNTYGGHECQCKSGFELDPAGACVDIDECALKLDNCREGTYCLNTVGTFTCTRAAPRTTTPAPYDYEYYDSEEDNSPGGNKINRDPSPAPPTLPSVQPAPTRPTVATSKPLTTAKATTPEPTTTTRPTRPPYTPRTTTRRPFTNTRRWPRPIPVNPPKSTPPTVSTEPRNVLTPVPPRPSERPERPVYSRPNDNRTDQPRPTYPRPEDSRTEPTRPSYSTPADTRTESTRPEYPRPEDSRTESTRPKYPRPEDTPTESNRPKPRPEPTRPNRPDDPRIEPKPHYNRPEDTTRPLEVKPLTPTNPVTIEKEKDAAGSYDLDTSVIPKERWTNVIGKEQPNKPDDDDFDSKEVHCLAGYEKNEKGDCEDINECANSRHICSSLEECENKPGGYICVCKAGYRRGETGWCEADGATNRTTTETPPPPPPLPPRPSERPRPPPPARPRLQPSSCELGYSYDPTLGRCVDIDECATRKANCAPDEDCHNVEGGYRCMCRGRCRSNTDLKPSYVIPPREAAPDSNVITVGAQYGQRGPRYMRPIFNRLPNSGAVLTSCPWGYKLTPDKMCLDIDECATNVSECGPMQRCENFYGGYSCQCPAGHRLVGQASCEDIDECRYGQPCAYNSACVNTVGSYRCACADGFRNPPANDRLCVDVDECSEDPRVCEQGCANSWGGYRCYCRPGYRLANDNRTCVDVDECAEWAAVRTRGRLCAGTCANTPGSYRCTCPAGYRASAAACLDIDECEAGGACGAGEVCQNTRGSFHCHRLACPPGYRLEDSHRCTRIQRQCPAADWRCLHQPSSYSYNFITFVSNIYLPDGRVDLFTMHGPAWSDAMVNFEMRMVSVQASLGATPVDLSCFEMRPKNNVCVISLTCSPEGPQVAELELTMTLYRRSQFAGSAVARLVVIVSQYEF